VSAPAIELNIALLPSPALSRRLVAISDDFAGRYPAVVRLGHGDSRLAIAPHLTLYQVPVPLIALTELHDGLRAIALSGRAAELMCKGLAYNEGEGSLEAQTDAPDELAELQRAVISLANPLRGGLLLERDPAGNRVTDLTGAGGPLGANIRHTGYAEVGELFRPHYTLNWFEPGTRLEAGDMECAADPVSLTGRCTALGMFALGPYGTCPQLLARYDFGA
jgi:hypothetical protein